MIEKLDAADLAAMSKVAPEIAELGETATEWWLGLFGLDKSSAYQEHASWTWPRWRAHFSTNVTAGMRLRVQPFERGSERALGVVLSNPEENYEHYVGWASSAREDQLREWVEFLNSEIVTLRALWDAAGRPTKNIPPKTAPAAPSRPVEPRRPPAKESPAVLHGTSTFHPPPGSQRARPKDDRLGRRLAHGRFEVTEWLGTDWLMGAAIARDDEQGGLVRLTFSADVAASIEELRAMFQRDVPGLAPVVYLGESASDDGWARGSVMMAERLPADAALLQLPSGERKPRELAAMGARLADHVLRVHRSGMVIGSLRPESTFVTPAGDLELLVRGERLWMMPRPDTTRPAMMPPWPMGYQAPELFKLLPLLRDPEPAADVFSLGVMLASALQGEFIYYALDFMQLFLQQQEGKHLPLPGTPLGEVLARCLRPSPGARPTLEELEQALTRLAEGSTSTN